MRIELKIAVLFFGLLLISCGGGGKKDKANPIEKYKQAEKISVAESASPDEGNLDVMSQKGVGPISSIALKEVDASMVAEGEKLFKIKCSACHRISKKFIGPAMKDIIKRRSPEWIMNMILNPEVMVKEDPIAKKLFEEYLSPMANQNLTEKEARWILEYFRTK